MIDIGVNINHPYFLNDLEQTLLDCSSAGVTDLICIASDLEESDLVQSLSLEHSAIWCTLGCHPHQAKTWNSDSSEQIRKLIAQQRPVAIGETGLDFNRNYSTPEQQILAFRAQIELAREFSLPLYLHERDAHATFVKILEENQDVASRSILHCFTGNTDELNRYLQLGLHIGITGWVCDERRGEELQQAVPHIPIDKLHFETDAPYLLPRTVRPRPKKNHPKYLPWVAEKVAELRNQPLDELIEQTRRNSQGLFRLNGC
ncbi:TatD family hydrolase [Marinomonas epiphytica]